MVEHKLRGMEEGREVGMVVGRGVVESGVVVRVLSGQCGRVVGMEQGVGVGVVEELGECGGQIHAGAIHYSTEEEKA